MGSNKIIDGNTITDSDPLQVRMLNPIVTVPVTIGAGASLSGVGVLSGSGQVVGIITDAAWDAAAVTFQVSADGSKFFNLRYDGSEFSEANPGASAFVALNPVLFAGAVAVKVRSGTSGAPVNQADATVVTLVCRPV